MYIMSSTVILNHCAARDHQVYRKLSDFNIIIYLLLIILL